MVYSFRKMFFIGQNLKQVHMKYSFLELLIFFCLKFIFHHTRNIVCEYKLHGKLIMKYQSWTCFWYWCWKNLFFNVKLIKLNMNKFSQFHEHIFRSSRSHMFFKIAALKNFAILKIKKRLKHRCFPVRSSHVVLKYW